MTITLEIIATLIIRFICYYCYVKHFWWKTNASEKITNEDERSDNGKKLRSYPAKTKVEAVKYAEIQ